MIKEISLLISFSIALTSGILVSPPSPAKHMLIFGFATPLILNDESIYYSWTVRAQYLLPESTADALKWLYFAGVWQNYDGTPPKNKTRTALNLIPQGVLNHWSKFPNGGKRRKRAVMIENDQDYEDEIDKANMRMNFSDFKSNIDEEFIDTSGTRWLLYDGFGKMLDKKGLGGRYCVLRSICEAAESNFGYHNGLFGQLFHILFTPSFSHDPIINKSHYDYVKAEMLGQAGEPCDKIFHQCKRKRQET